MISKPTMTRGQCPWQKATRVRDPWDVDEVLFNRLPGGTALLVTARALKVVPSGMPHRGPDMSPRDLRIVATSDKAAGSVWSEPWAWDLCDPLGCCGPARPASTAAYAYPFSVDPSYWLLWAASLPEVPWAADRHRTVARSQGGGWLAGSDGQSELESSSAFLLLTWNCGESGEVRASLPTPLLLSWAEALVAFALEAARAFFFLPASTAFLSSWRKTVESSMLEIASIKANSSCLGIAPTAGARFPLECSLCSAGGLDIKS